MTTRVTEEEAGVLLILVGVSLLILAAIAACRAPLVADVATTPEAPEAPACRLVPGELVLPDRTIPVVVCDWSR